MVAITLSLLGVLLSAREPITSRYSKLDEASCKILKAEEQGAYTLRRCRGIGGVDLLLQSFDDRDDVRLANPTGEEDLHLDHVTGWFNHVGEVVEWRMAGRTVVALILRIHLDGPDTPDGASPHSYLVIAKVRSGASCVTRVIDARSERDANVHARTFADQAQSAACLWQ
jgi:hypothetical protein